MRIFQPTLLTVFTLWAFSSPSRAFAVPQDGPGNEEIGRTTEKELKVVLTTTFGSVSVSRGESEKVLVVEGKERDDEHRKVNIDYSIRNRVGYMDVALGDVNKEGGKDKGSFKIDGFSAGHWDLKFTDAVPISFDIELGVGKGDFDLSGLQVKDFNLSTGASEVHLSFGEPNKTSIENLNIESGLSKFTGRNLGNANFKRFKFQGGVGAYTLDFGGALNNEVDVDVEVGLGVLTILVPDDVGARVTYEKSWISKVDCADDFRSSGDNEFISDNYFNVSGRMNIKIDSGLGSVKIRRR